MFSRAPSTSAASNATMHHAAIASSQSAHPGVQGAAPGSEPVPAMAMRGLGAVRNTAGTGSEPGLPPLFVGAATPPVQQGQHLQRSHSGARADARQAPLYAQQPALATVASLVSVDVHNHPWSVAPHTVPDALQCMHAQAGLGAGLMLSAGAVNGPQVQGHMAGAPGGLASDAVPLQQLLLQQLYQAGLLGQVQANPQLMLIHPVLIYGSAADLLLNAGPAPRHLPLQQYPAQQAGAQAGHGGARLPPYGQQVQVTQVGGTPQSAQAAPQHAELQRSPSRSVVQAPPSPQQAQHGRTARWSECTEVASPPRAAPAAAAVAPPWAAATARRAAAGQKRGRAAAAAPRPATSSNALLEVVALMSAAGDLGASSNAADAPLASPPRRRQRRAMPHLEAAEEEGEGVNEEQAAEEQAPAEPTEIVKARARAILAWVIQHHHTFPAVPGRGMPAGSFVEKTVRHLFGDTPDTSKGLRWLVDICELLKDGKGGRSGAFHYRLPLPRPAGEANGAAAV